MSEDVAFRLPPGVAVEPVAHMLEEARDGAIRQHRAAEVVIDAEHIKKLRQVRRVPIPPQVTLGNADVNGAENAPAELVIVDCHSGGWSIYCAATTLYATMGKGDGELAAAEPGCDAKRKTCHARDVL